MTNTPQSYYVMELLRFADAHRRHTESLARATGENFNIFKILGIGHYEVRTHSPILGDLLNPNGSHGQGDTFLRLFIDQLDIEDFEPASARVELEHHIGPKTENSGGRIDIVIYDGKGHAIFIENKIYADDQEKQLQRYRERNAKAHLFYLTLQGDLPAGFTEESLKDIRAIRISYASHIRDWLVACRKEAVSLPQARETISQYLHLIRELTGQSFAQFMNEDLIQKITADDNSLAAYFTLTSAFGDVQSALAAKLDAQLSVAAKAVNLLHDGRSKNLQVQYSFIYFTTETLRKHNLRIGFWFARKDYQDFCFGFMKTDEKQACPKGDEILALFRDSFLTHAPEPANDWSPAFAGFEPPHRNWGAEAFRAVGSGMLADSMREKMIKMAAIAQKVYPD